MIKQTIQGIKIVFQDKDSWWVGIAAALGISYLFYWLLYKVTTITNFFQMVKDGEFGKYSYLYAGAYWLTTILTVIFFAISTALLVWLWKHSKFNQVSGGSSVAGAFFGALGAACPVCGAFLLSLFGVTGGLTIFPLQGLEFKFTSLAFMIGSTVFAASKVNAAADCDECDDISSKKKHIVLNWEKILVPVLAVFFMVNQFFISSAASKMGLPTGAVAQLFGIKTVATKTIIAPKLNPDGKTTSLVEQPTISEISANPESGNALADAKVVMLARGKPFYAPDDIAFDDPINAQKKWGSFVKSINLSGEIYSRYQKLISSMVCSYCCGTPTSVTTINRCGCAHARAVQGFYKYMLQNYGGEYSDDQLLGEAHRWYAIWYPKGMLEDYLLATGKSGALPHNTHGGAGTDGRHGL